MPKAAEVFVRVAGAVASATPYLGELVKELLGLLGEKITEHEAFEKQRIDLKKKLPDFLIALEKSTKCVDVGEDYKKLVEDVRSQVEIFNKYVQLLEIDLAKGSSKTMKAVRKKFITERDQLIDSIEEYEKRATALHRQQGAQTNTVVLETRDGVNSISKTLDETKGGVEEIAKTTNATNAAVQTTNSKLHALTEIIMKSILPLAKLIENPEYVKNLREGSGGTVSFGMDELGDVLATLQSGTSKQKRAAMHDAVRIALGFVRDGNERAVAMGLALLDRVIGDTNARRLIMKNASVVRTLLGREMKHPGDNTVSWMLEHLAEESELFFDQLEPLAMQPKYHSAIASAGLIPWIVEGAKPTAVEQDQDQEAGMDIGDEVALRVLVEIAKSSECKSAIVKAGGIGVLVEDYRLLELNEYEVDPIIIDVADALAGLAEDAACREEFARANGYWALLNFLWKCGTTKTEHYDGKETTLERTKFDRETVLSVETRAGRALWTLVALGGEWKHHVLYLGELYLGKLHLKTFYRNRDCDNLRALRGAAACPQFDAVRGWLRLSNFIEKTQVNENKRTNWFVPIVWSLLMDESTSFIAAEWCFGGDLSDRRRCESAVFTVVAKDKKAYIKWSLHESEDIKVYEWTAYSSDEESSDDEASDEEASDEDAEEEDAAVGESSDAESANEESSDAESVNEESSDAEASVAEASDAEASDAEASDDDVSLGDKKIQREERSAVDRALAGDRVESQLIDSICSYLALPRDNCKRLSTCLLRVLWALEAGTTDRRAKALCVLWLSAGFLNIYRTPVNRLAEICKKAMTSGREDEIFWATCLLLTMVSWPSVREKRPRTRRVEMVEVAAAGVCELLKSDEWPKYVFLSKYLVAKEAGVMGAACIPFLVASYLKLKKAGEVLNDDSYFQSKTHRDSKPLSEKELREDCLEQLGRMWLDHESEIAAEGGIPVMKAMLRSKNVDDDDKSSIERALQDTVKDTVTDTVTATVTDTVNDTVNDTMTVTVTDTAMDTLNDAVKDTVTDTVEECTKQLSQDTVP